MALWVKMLMWSTILIATKYGIDFKNRFCIFLLWSSQSYSWSIQAGSVIYSGRKYKHLLWFSTSLPLILGSSASKEISETMDWNETNKINIGRRCKAFNMKDHYSNENNSFKLKLVKPAFLGLPQFSLQQIICLTYLLNVCVF